MCTQKEIKKEIQELIEELGTKSNSKYQQLLYQKRIVNVLKLVLEKVKAKKISLEEADSLFARFLPFTHMDLDQELSDIICCGASLELPKNHRKAMGYTLEKLMDRLKQLEQLYERKLKASTK